MMKEPPHSRGFFCVSLEKAMDVLQPPTTKRAKYVALVKG